MRAKDTHKQRALPITLKMDEHLSRERQAARLLRNTQWWKRRRSLGLCFYCKAACKPSELTMDHIVPMIRGGRSTRGNVVPACKTCNSQKKDTLLMDWEPYR